jgi:hypothetical protein
VRSRLVAKRREAHGEAEARKKRRWFRLRLPWYPCVTDCRGAAPALSWRGAVSVNEAGLTAYCGDRGELLFQRVERRRHVA